MKNQLVWRWHLRGVLSLTARHPRAVDNVCNKQNTYIYISIKNIGPNDLVTALPPLATVCLERSFLAGCAHRCMALYNHGADLEGMARAKGCREYCVV